MKMVVKRGFRRHWLIPLLMAAVVASITTAMRPIPVQAAGPAPAWAQRAEKTDESGNGENGDGGKDNAAEADRLCKTIEVALPITLSSVEQMRGTIQTWVTRAPIEARLEDRAVLVLEFVTRPGRDGRGSDLGACISLAQFLTSAAVKRVRTVAWIHGGSNAAAGDDSGDANGEGLRGHAVLVAIATGDLAMTPNARLGSVSVSQEPPAAFVNDVYRSIAEDRLTLPVDVALSMLDKNRGLYRVNTANGVRYTDRSGRDDLETSGDSIDSQTLMAPGQPPELSGRQLAEFRLINLLVDDRLALAGELKVSPEQLKVDFSGDQDWEAISIEMPTVLDIRQARWMMRSILPTMRRRNANLLVLRFDDSTGDPDAGVQLGRFIASLRNERIRTVAVVQRSLQSGAAVVALSCDQMLMQQKASVGGFGPAENPGDPPEGSIPPSRQKSFQIDAEEIAKSTGGDWSMLLAMIDASTEVVRFRNTGNGQVRLLSNRERDARQDADDFQPLGPLETRSPITSMTARQSGLSSMTFDTFEQVRAFYQLEEDPVPLRPTSTDRWIESLASFLTSPFVAPLLVMGAFFLISTEISSPGLGVPGFLGALCLVAYFWSQSFDGNAKWFEILLFVVGVAFLLMEFFVIPGFGIFGIGGIMMVSAAIVLAAQSFLIPHNLRELEQLPNSLFPLIGGGFGIVIAGLLLPKLLPNMPLLKNVILAPPGSEESIDEVVYDRVSVADLAFLKGRTGLTMTKLMPGGRAKFGDRIVDVITQGQVVERGVKVRVTNAVGNRVVVEADEESEERSA